MFRFLSCSNAPTNAIGLNASCRLLQPNTGTIISHAVVIWCCAVIGILQFANLAAGQGTIEGEIQVLPVFFKPSDQPKPKQADIRKLRRHLLWAQKRYRELLHNKSTFQIAGKPETYTAREPLSFYKDGDSRNAFANIADELLDWKKTDRYDCKFVFLAIVVNSKDKYPKGRGRPLNGGFNTGGGVATISLHALRNSPNFQSTLQHELGHTFGLNHIEVYGYDMKRNDSIMSYNPNHHTDKFKASSTPGLLIPEDRRGLAMNDLVFPGLDFNPKRDIPDGYEIVGIVTFPPLKIPNQSNGIKVSTDGGETYNSSVSNIVHGRIYPSIDRGKTEFNSKRMWHSDKLESGWASVDLDFPKPVTLDRIEIYSQHSGYAHLVSAAKVFTIADDKIELRCEKSGLASHASLSFESVEAKKWKLELQAGKSKAVVVRGLRFFNGESELYPQLVPASEEK